MGRGPSIRIYVFYYRWSSAGDGLAGSGTSSEAGRHRVRPGGASRPPAARISGAHFRPARIVTFQPQDALPEDRRRCSLPRLPLVDDGFAGRANASGQAVLRESEPTTKGPELLFVFVRDRRQGRWTHLLPSEPSVVSGHEPLAGRPRDESDGTSKCRASPLSRSARMRPDPLEYRPEQSDGRIGGTRSWALLQDQVAQWLARGLLMCEPSCSRSQ